jgi:Flp pilus assembly protein TadG
MTRPGLQDEGAIAVIVAILFGTFVLLGCAALTIDVGNINLDRRQLQNSADSVALAVAKDCADTGTCKPNDPSLQALANANSAHGATAIRRVDGLSPAICGNAPGLVACPAASAPNSGNLQECPGANPTGSTQYVRVYTETLQRSGGAHILPYSFGAAIAGAGSGADQQACASVSWGPIGSYTTGAPITISLCMFDQLVGGVANLPAAPDSTFPGYGPGHASGWPTPSPEVAEFTTKYASNCANSNGHAANGSFGWLTNLSCMATATTGNWIQGNPGNNMACDMSPYWGKKILVPIYDCIVTSGSDPGAPPLPSATCAIPSGGGSNIWYHIAGWASFYLSGYRFPGSSQPSTLTGNPICSSPDSCLGGWLTDLQLSNAPTGYGKNYGVSTLTVVG